MTGVQTCALPIWLIRLLNLLDLNVAIANLYNSIGIVNQIRNDMYYCLIKEYNSEELIEYS